jgi:hypothetical protein
LPLAEEAIALATEIGNAFHLVEATATVGQAYKLLGDLDQSERYTKEAIAMHREARTLPMATYMVFALSTLESERGRYLRAMRLYGAAEGLLAQYATVAPSDAILMGDPLGRSRAALGDDAVDAAIAEGKAMDPEEAIAYALSDSE